MATPSTTNESSRPASTVTETTDDIDQLVDDLVDRFTEQSDLDVNFSLADNDTENKFEDLQVKDVEATLKETLETKGLPAVLQKAYEKLNFWKRVSFKIGISGNSGSGKSSLVNALRDLKPNDEEAAPVDVVECTSEPTSYPHPKNPNITIWDLPGIGTARFPMETYAEKMRLESFDFFIIICSCRFTENDVYLAKTMRSMGKLFYFVRSKVDFDIFNNKRNNPTETEESTLIRIKHNCVSGLKSAGIHDPVVYLINSYDKTAYEFGTLFSRIINEVDGRKTETFVFSFRAISTEFLDEKKKKLQDRISRVAFLYTFKQFIPFSNPFGGIVEEVMFYSEQFNIDRKTKREVEDILRQKGIELAKDDTRQDGDDKGMLRLLKWFVPRRFWIRSTYRQCCTTLTEILDVLYTEAKAYAENTAKDFSKLLS